MKISFDIDDRIVAVAARMWAIARHRITRALLGLFVLVGAGAVAHAEIEEITLTEFREHKPALASEVNANFQALRAAINEIRNVLTATKRQTIRLPGSAANRNLAASNNGYFYAHPDRDSWGQVAVSLPVGSVITGMTCYVDNSSTVPAGNETYFYGELRELAVDDSLKLARAEAWPDKPGLQKLVAKLEAERIPVRADQAYFVQFGIELPNGTPAEQYYLGPDPDDRLLRHYGCHLDYEAPSLAASQTAEGG